MNIIAENIKRIKTEIGNARLVAVSKKQDVQKIRDALSDGHRIFGENRVQEAAEKFPDLRVEFDDIELHLIGPLQTNKVKDALEIFDVIQTLDREKLAKHFAKELEGSSRVKEFYVQVNTGEEDQKAGVLPNQASEFIGFCKNDLGLNVTGLMCIPPVDEPCFMHFALLRNILEKYNRSSATKAKRASPNGSIRSCELSNLSMGMSADYMDAVELGATHIRVGTGVFGEREY